MSENNTNKEISNSVDVKTTDHILDLFENDIINVSLDDEKPLFTKLYSATLEKINSVKADTGEFLSSFEKFLKEQIDIINKSVKDGEPNYIYATNVLFSQIKIYNYYCINLLDGYLQSKDYDCYQILGNISENIYLTITKIVDIIFKLSQKTKSIKDDLGQYDSLISQKDIYIKQLEEQNSFLNDKINKLQEENFLITQKLFNITNNLKVKNDLKKNNNKTLKKNASIDCFFRYKENNPYYKNNNLINSSDFYSNTFGSNKVLSIKMMKDVIRNIYDSKIVFDKTCEQNKLPKQTLEQFMYTYLTQKYGLQNIVMEWATNLINGIKNFSSEDNEICLFGKILKNELEENCSIFIPIIKDKISGILVNILRKEYPYKTEESINKMKENIEKGEISQEKAEQIIDLLFDKENGKSLINKINQKVQNKKNIFLKNEENDENKKNRHKKTREEYVKIITEKENQCNFVPFDYFFDICLGKQIKLHIKYLKPIIDLFQSIDTDKDGIINEEEFCELIKRMEIFGTDNNEQIIEELLDNIDPYKNKSFTFSELINWFGKINFDDTQTIIERFCGNGEKNSTNKNNSKVSENTV